MNVFCQVTSAGSSEAFEDGITHERQEYSIQPQEQVNEHRNIVLQHMTPSRVHVIFQIREIEELEKTGKRLRALTDPDKAKRNLDRLVGVRFDRRTKCTSSTPSSIISSHVRRSATERK